MSETLVVLRPLGLGDAVIGAPAYKALARAFPSHRRVYAGPQELQPLIESFGLFDDFAPVGAHEPLPRSLHRVDVAVDMHGKGPRSHRVLLASEPRRLLAFEHPEVPQSSGMARWDDDEHEAARWCRMLRRFGVHASPNELALSPPPLRVPSFVRGATLVHVGAKAAARRWPLERFADVIAFEKRRGHSTIITGGKAEAALVRELAIASAIPPHRTFAGCATVLGLAALVAASGRVVCGDTGVAHLATAYGTPSVVLFGPVPPQRWGPPPHSRLHRALWAGRTGDPHATRVDAGLLAIESCDVIEALRTLGDAHAALAG